MAAHFRRLYGDSPLHLLAFTACLLVAAAAVVGWFESFPGPTVLKILEWFAAAIVAHDLVVLPLYSLLDRIAFGAVHRRSAPAPARERAHGLVYVRVPVLLSGLVLLVFLPEILRLGDQSFYIASGFHQSVFLARYLFTAAAIFGLSGLAYAWSLARARRAGLAHQGVDRLGAQDAERDVVDREHGGRGARTGEEPSPGADDPEDR